MFSFQGLMLPDLISANLISDYLVVELLDSVNDLQGTSKVRLDSKFLLLPALRGI